MTEPAAPYVTGHAPRTFEVMLHCQCCGAAYDVQVRHGPNEVSIECACGAITKGTVEISRTGHVMTYGLTVEKIVDG